MTVIANPIDVPAVLEQLQHAEPDPLGSLKMWVNRQGIAVARCTVERLMKGTARKASGG